MQNLLIYIFSFKQNQLYLVHDTFESAVFLSTRGVFGVWTMVIIAP